jgi:hypothetical protein
MSDNYTDDDNFDLEGEDGNNIQSLRKAANSAKRLKAELAQLKREVAFAKAGIPLDDPRMSYFVKGYDGDLEPEAIREAATTAGFLTVPQQQDAAQNAQQQAAVVAEQRVMAASAGAVAEDTSEAAAMARMEAAMQEGGIEAMLDVARQYGIPTSTEY